MLADLAAWLADTSISRSFGATLWVVPFSQSLHILAIAAVMASAWILSFRLLGLAGRAETIAQTYARYAPWIWRALVVLLLTGLVLIIGEPARQLTNAAFLTKLGISLEHLCDWPDRMREHGQQVVLVAVDGRAAGFFGVVDGAA